MNRPPLPYITAYLQFAVAILFMLGYFFLLWTLFTGSPVIPENLLELAKTIAIGMTNALGLLFAFLYLRSRVDGPPDPEQTTTKQVTESVTTPTGTPKAPVIDKPLTTGD